jgi:hypothetical protein
MCSSHNAKLILIHSCAQIRFNSTQHDFRIRWCSRRLRVIQRVSLVEQELLTILERLSSPPGFSGDPVVQSLVFCVMFCR